MHVFEHDHISSILASLHWLPVDPFPSCLRLKNTSSPFIFICLYTKLYYFPIHSFSLRSGIPMWPLNISGSSSFIVTALHQTGKTFELFEPWTLLTEPFLNIKIVPAEELCSSHCRKTAIILPPERRRNISIMPGRAVILQFKRWCCCNIISSIIEKPTQGCNQIPNVGKGVKNLVCYFINWRGKKVLSHLLVFRLCCGDVVWRLHVGKDFN